jgi:hypothetical protein
MRHLNRILFIPIVIIAIFNPAWAAQEQWQRITDPEAGFNISFPGRPTYQQITNPVTGEPAENYSFVYNQHHLQIMFWHLTDPPRTAAEATQVLNSISRVYARNAGTLLRQEKLPGGGRQYDNVLTDKEGTLHLRTRIYLLRGMFFQLSYGTYSPEGIDEGIAERFFSSFSLTTASPGKRGATRGRPLSKPSSAGTDRAKWYPVRDVKGGFYVEFPGKPDYQESDDNEAGITFHQYICYFGENTFIVNYREKHKGEPSPEQIIRLTAEDYIAEKNKWGEPRQVRLPNGSYQIESEGTINNSPMRLRIRLYVRGDRLYFVTSVTRNLIGPNQGDLDKFFVSFRLL